MIQAAQPEVVIPQELQGHMQVSPQAHPEGVEKTAENLEAQLRAHGLDVSNHSTIAHVPVAPKTDGEEDETSHGPLDAFARFKNEFLGPKVGVSGAKDTNAAREVARARYEAELQKQSPEDIIQVK